MPAGRLRTPLSHHPPALVRRLHPLAEGRRRYLALPIAFDFFLPTCDVLTHQRLVQTNGRRDVVARPGVLCGETPRHLRERASGPVAPFPFMHRATTSLTEHAGGMLMHEYARSGVGCPRGSPIPLVAARAASCRQTCAQCRGRTSFALWIRTPRGGCCPTVGEPGPDTLPGGRSLPCSDAALPRPHHKIQPDRLPQQGPGGCCTGRTRQALPVPSTANMIS